MSRAGHLNTLSIQTSTLNNEEGHGSMSPIGQKVRTAGVAAVVLACSAVLAESKGLDDMKTMQAGVPVRIMALGD